MVVKMNHSLEVIVKFRLVNPSKGDFGELHGHLGKSGFTDVSMSRNGFR